MPTESALLQNKQNVLPQNAKILRICANLMFSAKKKKKQSGVHAVYPPMHCSKYIHTQDKTIFAFIFKEKNTFLIFYSILQF